MVRLVMKMMSFGHFLTVKNNNSSHKLLRHVMTTVITLLLMATMMLYKLLQCHRMKLKTQYHNYKIWN